jgi:tripartite-type tricarboxylate transporter receptor subunit TctC
MQERETHVLKSTMEVSELHHMRKLAFLIVLVFVFVFAYGCAAFAAYPEKPVEVIVAFSPGGGTDTAARIVFKFTEKYFPEKFAIINKPGASGEIGFTAIATAKPDGYTIGMINPPTLLMHPIQREGCKYTLADFKPIANIVMDPGCVAVKPGGKFNSFDELIKAAKSKPKAISIGYSGPGTGEAKFLRQLETMEGFEFNKIPFEGSAPSVVALMGGHIDAVCMNVSEAYNHVQEGNLKVLGAGSPKRSAMMPDVPTYREMGYDLIQVSLRGVAGPAGMPEEAAKAIEEALQKVMDDPEFQAKAADMQLPLEFMGSEEYKEFLEEMDKDLRTEWEKSPW